MDNKIGKYRIISKGTKVFLLSLQKNIYFENNIVVKITNMTYNNYMFGILQDEYYYPTVKLTDITNGEITFNYDDTIEYSSDLPF